MSYKKNILLTLLVFIFVLQSCGNEIGKAAENNNSSKIVQVQTGDILRMLKSALRPNQKIAIGKIYTDTVQYINFNDEGDNRLFFVKKNKNTIGLIYHNEQLKYTRGDQIEIKWKTDSIQYAGDPEFLNYTEFLVSAKRLKPLQLTDKKIKFLWREIRYDAKLKANVNTIMLNKAFIKNISDPEKAVLAYAATFVGNDCEWNGKADENRSNLKCKILAALNLGYQCSFQHLDFLRHWFRSNKEMLKALENCPTTPNGATVQDTFDEINLEVKGNLISIFFKVNGINMREGKSWSWTEKHTYQFKGNELVLIKKDISPTTYRTFKVSGN